MIEQFYEHPCYEIVSTLYKCSTCQCVIFVGGKNENYFDFLLFIIKCSTIDIYIMTQFILIYFSLIMKQVIFAYVSHIRIHSWNQPVLSKQQVESFLLKETVGSFDGTHNRPIDSQAPYPLHHPTALSLN